MSRKDGGPAYPGGWTDDPGTEFDRGMSLRDWFAGMALQGMLANTTITQAVADNNLGSSYVAGQAFHAADAMLQAREESQDG